MPLTRYALMVVVDPSTGFAIGLTKKKGPAHLLDRLTFPGGKIEEGECPAAAASRELLEETGVAVAAQDWVAVEVKRGEGFELHLFAAQSNQVLHATRQADEVEPVWHMACARHLDYARRQPDQYVADFIPLLEKSLDALGCRDAVLAPAAATT
jgi:8-oxo-dGTP pyrophosphatase MutT (NUDIX family)